MDKVLVLGISGFTGSHFQEYVLKNRLSDEFSFVGADRHVQQPTSFPCHQIDFLDNAALEELLVRESPSYIINFAGHLRGNNYEEMLRINAGISWNVIEIVRLHNLNVKGILLIGSAAEYGTSKTLPIQETTEPFPINHYGLSKLVQTNYARYFYHAFNLRVMVARTFNIIGRNMSPHLAIGSFVNQIKMVSDKGTISTGNLNAKRDYLDIEDVVDAYWRILLKGNPGDIYNVCSGKSHSMNKILLELIKCSKKRTTITCEQSRIQEHDIQDSYGDNTKIQQQLGWSQKIDIDQAICRLFS